MNPTIMTGYCRMWIKSSKSMDFSQYKIFRDGINKEYGKYYKKYPSAFFVLDYLVQLRVNNDKLKNRQLTDWTDWAMSLYLDKLTKFSFSACIYCLYLRVVSYFPMCRNKECKIHVAIEDHKFPGLNKVISKIASKNNWEVVFQGNRSFSNILDFMLLKRISPYRCFISRRTKKLLFKFRKFDKDAWKELLDDRELMMQLNRSVQQDTVHTAQLIKRLGINIFINTGDSSGNARILIDSSKYYDSKTISFAHGYIQNKKLMSIAPIRSDKLILWTNKQLLDISAAVDHKQSKKLSYIGFPKKYISGNASSDDSTSLLLMGYIEDMLKDNKLDGIFINVIEALRRLPTKVKLRLHPHERCGIPIIEEFVAKNNIELSNSNLDSDIAEADYIIGANSSTLVEAASCGKNVFEVEELSNIDFDLEGVIKIKVKQIQEIKLFSNRVDNFDVAFNEKELEKNLTKLIISVYNSPNAMTELQNHDGS